MGSLQVQRHSGWLREHHVRLPLSHSEQVGKSVEMQRYRWDSQVIPFNLSTTDTLGVLQDLEDVSVVMATVDFISTQDLEVLFKEKIKSFALEVSFSLIFFSFLFCYC